MLLEKEGGERRVLIPAAMLHDIGWAEVPLELQMAVEWDAAKRALFLHLKNAPPVARKILKSLGFTKKEIEKIVDIILSHKFKNPRNLEKRLLIDIPEWGKGQPDHLGRYLWRRVHRAERLRGIHLRQRNAGSR